MIEVTLPPPVKLPALRRSTGAELSMRFSFVSLNRSAARTGVRGLAAAIVCSAALPAFAADMPGSLPDYENVSSHERKKPLFAGSYMGLEAGVSGNTDRSKGSGKKSSSRMDAAFGLFGGYNWQMGSAIAGVEGSATYLGNKKTAAGTGALSGVRSHSPWTADIKGRVGMPVGQFMPYLSAGVALTQHTHQMQGFKDKKSVAVRPVVGGGLEMAMTDNMRLRADYTLTMGSNKKQSFGSTTFKESSTNHRLMFGASYAF